MKTTLELPDPLFRRAKIVAAQRGTTMKELVIAGLQQVMDGGPSSPAPAGLTAEESAIAELGAHGLPMLRRTTAARRKKVTCALVDRIRDELSL